MRGFQRFCCVVASAGTVVFLLISPAFAQDEALELEAVYPRVESEAPGAVFKFPVSVAYHGSQPRQFNLRASGPSDWSTYVTSTDETIRVSVIRLEPGERPSDRVMVVSMPSPSARPPVGEYRVSLTVGSGDISETIELVAVVVPTYSMEVSPRSLSYHKITAGEDSEITIRISNTGSGILTSIDFSLSGPSGWTVAFDPAEIASLAPGASRDVRVTINAPEASTAYREVSLDAASDQVRQTAVLNIRVDEPEGSWVWVGGVVGGVVVAAFVYVFLRFGRSR